MYNATCKVFENFSVQCPNGRSRGEARGTYKHMRNFDFVFSLHLMYSIMIITVLCQALRRKSQDILTAMRFVFTTTNLLHKLRDDDWEEFLGEVKKFCSKHDIEIPDLESLYKVGLCRSRDPITMEYHYYFDVFNEAIDYVLMELNTRFTSVELLTLSTALDPRDSFKSFNSHDICILAKKFYPEDFSKQNICILEYELRHYKLDVNIESRFQVSILVELCRQLAESRRSETYIMVTRLIRLVLTLHVSTTTNERAFSTMKHMKTDFRNRMDDEFLADCMTLFIERELAEKIHIDFVIDDFYVSKPRQEQLQIK